MCLHGQMKALFQVADHPLLVSSHGRRGKGALKAGKLGMGVGRTEWPSFTT